MLARHDLVWLTAQGWRQVRAGMAPEAEQELITALDAWRGAGWPAVVRRAEADPAPEEVAIGFALPPRPGDGRKVRIGSRVDVAEIVRHTPALPLAGALGAVPDGWRTALAALSREAADAGLDLAVYGSVALAAITGQRYVTPASDIDLLLRPLDREQLAAGLALVARHAALLPLDGEVVFPDGRAVAWKELRMVLDTTPGTRVLAKSLERVALAVPDDLLATLEDAPCLS
ncbi:malonate decarboxylase holo-[acyl-carrier-protein] synthase [Pseudoduganella umbonata]|uniref:Malonate decarboxylase holo-[acyl-carrier-protein] synthase n=1 Tax=Pseudoduganella umbonata TaxID=864828 RepID=A0A4P8I0G1_9BURK|nr:malonate decarboxylase holo-[acyl-carrier-protein] synthase [Pseudoduganella umbonata]MBB3221950.1 phosphoribosyl-dephospho-CoA transferase [Pseudoduganella umbonata]QCP14255.1 malonate decarboxylase holo-[acyl-carrier-protein] synthase [Pseudoduganella umbonata]